MIKTGSKDKGNLRVNSQSAEWEKLRDSLYRFSLLSGFDAYEVFNNSKKINLLGCRNNELWSPLLALAEYLDAFDPEANLLIPLAKMAKDEEEHTDNLDDWHLALLDSLRDTVTLNKRYLVNEIRNNMSRYIEDRFEFEKISGRWVGNALNRLGFRRAPRQSGGAAYYIDPEKVIDLRQRYGLENVLSEVNDEETREEELVQMTLVPPTPNTSST